MATYNFNGQVIDAPDSMPEGEVLSLLQGKSKAQPGTTPDAQTPAEQPALDPYQLKNNKDWVNASRIAWLMNNPKPPRPELMPSDEELAEYGAKQMDWLENTLVLGVDSARISMASPEQKEAFGYLMDTYPSVKWSIPSALRTARSLATDPFNWTFLVSMGAGTAANQATKLMSRQALRQLLKAGTRAGLENAAIGAGQSVARQNIRVEAGRQDSISGAQVAVDAGISGAAGFALGGTVDALGTALRKPAAKLADDVAPNPASPGAAASPNAPAAAASPSAEAPAAPGLTPEANAAPQADFIVGSDGVAQKPNSADFIVDPNGNVTPNATPEATPEVTPSAAPEAAPEVTPETPTPEASGDNPILQAVSHIQNNGFRFFPTTREGMSGDAQKAVDYMLNTPVDLLKKQVDDARMAATDDNKAFALKTAFRDATQKVYEEIAEHEKAGRFDQSDKLQEVAEVLRDPDLDYSSGDGASLGGRAGNINVGPFRDVNPETLLRARGIDPATANEAERSWARREYGRRIVRQAERQAMDEDIRTIANQIDDAVKTGDHETAAMLTLEKEALIKEKAEAIPDPTERSYAKAANFAQRLAVEVMISNVFSPKTLVMNTIPTAIKMAMRPALDAVVKGGGRQAWREAAAMYGAMWNAQSVSLRAALVNFKLERGLLSGDMNRILEHGPVIPQKYGGGIVRILPRTVGATDEYMQTVLYRGYAGQMGYITKFEEALAKGMSKKQANKYAQKNLESWIEANAFMDPEANDVVDALVQSGRNRGLKGDSLKEFIKTELDTNLDLYRKPTLHSGLNFAKDMLFQRKFSGEGLASKGAQKYEQTVNAFPIMRLFGQLFFRTPARVFEEAFRLTPGLNVIAPHFVRDLAGKGPGGPGAPAQLRAQGEAMLSLAFGSAIISMYVQDRITGAGPNENWRQARGMKTAGYEPYTIYFGDPKDKNTYKFNFRNYDPFAGPLKILVNALDGFNMVQVRKAQGEYVDQEEKLSLAYMSAGMLGVVQAIRDASLTEGFDQLAQIAKNIQDPENNESQLVRWFAQKAQMMVPNTWTKVQQQQGNPLADPATFWQYLEARTNPNSKTLPKLYDAMGFPVYDPNPIAQLTGVDLRRGGKGESTGDPKRDFINEELKKIIILTNKHFIAPYDAGSWAVPGLKGWKGVDLRAEMTKDGKETYYDRLQRYVSQSNLTNQLYNTFKSGEKLPTGTPSTPAMKVEHVTKLVSQARKQAFFKLVSEESGMLDRSKAATIKELQTKLGLFDVEITPYQ